MVLPALDTTLAGINTSAAGFKVFFPFGVLGSVGVFLACHFSGTGSANPNAGLSRPTEMVCSFAPTLTRKNLSSFLKTQNGPSYGLVRGIRLAPCRTKTCSASLSAAGIGDLVIDVCQTGSGHSAAAMSAYNRVVKSCSGCCDSGGSAATGSWPGSTRFVPYTHSVGEKPTSALCVVRIPSRACGSRPIHLAGSPVAINKALRVRWNLSSNPLDCGWYAGVLIFLIANVLPISVHSEEVNCAPLSEVRLLGTPNLATQPRMRALAHAVAMMSGTGIASGHLDHLSAMVKTYECPSD